MLGNRPEREREREREREMAVMSSMPELVLGEMAEVLRMLCPLVSAYY
jgi:hypothetical protein